MKPFAWSYTALTGFETCPHRHYRTKVAKDVQDPPGEAALWGQRVHKALEERLRDKTPLPKEMASYETYAARFDGLKGGLLVEQQIAITRNMLTTEWFGKDTWLRGAIDVGVVNGSKAVLADWKTGKRKMDSEQLKLFAGLGFVAYPKVEVIKTLFVWLPDKKVDQAVFTREDAKDIWASFVPRVVRMEAAYKKGLAGHPKKPSGLCRNWCPVTDCEFNGRKGA